MNILTRLWKWTKSWFTHEEEKAVEWAKRTVKRNKPPSPLNKKEKKQ